MIVVKSSLNVMPEYCDDCIYYECRPHPYKGWTECCNLCCHSIDDDVEEDWIYDGNGRPKKCPLIDVPDEEAVNVTVSALENNEEPKKGKWIDGHRMKFDGTFYWYRECDQCGYERNDDDTEKDSNFCPNCGSPMVKGEQDD